MKKLAINTIVFTICILGISTILKISVLSVIGLFFCIGFAISSFENAAEALIKSFKKDTKTDQ